MDTVMDDASIARRRHERPVKAAGLDQWEYASSHVCVICHEVQPVQPNDRCRACGAPVVEREP